MAQRGPAATLHPHLTCVAQHVIRVWIGPGAQDLGSMVAHGFIKQGPASTCSRWPIASFTLPGLTHPVRLYPVYPCILGLNSTWCYGVCARSGWRGVSVL